MTGTSAARHHFVVPAAASTITGGNLYNRELLAALGQAPFGVSTLDLTSAREVLGATPSGFFWLDSLYLEHFRALRAVAPRGTFGLLLHYLPSLVERGGLLVREQLTEDERLALDQADAFMVTSHWMAAAVRGLGGRRRPLLVVEPGRPEPPPATPPSPTSGACAVLVANLVPGKGILPFLRALAAEIEPSDRFQLTIVGGALDMVYAERCRALVAGDPLLSIRIGFAGELAPAAALSRLAASNLLVSSSRFEAYGMALSEARVAGIPILARGGGNALEFVAPAWGGQLCAGDRELARAALELSRNPMEHGLRLQCARRTRLAPRPWSHAAGDFIAQARLLEGSGRKRREPSARGTTGESRARTTR